MNKTLAPALALILAVIASMVAAAVLLVTAGDGDTSVDLPTTAECAEFGAGNLLDHWTAGQVLDTCDTSSVGYQSVLYVVTRNNLDPADLDYLAAATN